MITRSRELEFELPSRQFERPRTILGLNRRVAKIVQLANIRTGVGREPRCEARGCGWDEDPCEGQGL